MRFKTITYKQFVMDYKERYESDEMESHVKFDAVIYYMYNACRYDDNYPQKTITLYYGD